MATGTVSILYREEMRPDFFFVRTSKQSKEYEAMDALLQNYFKSDENPLFPQLQINDMMACFIDGKYQRCKFLYFDQSVPTVYLVDDGRTLAVPFDACFGIPVEFSQTNACTLRCHLDIDPQNGKDWSDDNGDGLDYFKKICYQQQLNACKMVFRKDHPVVLNGWNSACIDLCWEDLKYDGYIFFPLLI